MQNAATLVCLILIAPCLSTAQTTNADDKAAPAMTEPRNPLPAQSALAPLTESERLHEYLKDWVNPVSLMADAAGAGIGQWRDRPREWRQGGEGYARRFGSSYAQHVAYSTLLFGASSLLHEDNRYVLSGQSGFSHRLEYAVGSAVLARHDDPGGLSHRRLSVSRIGAFAGAALVSRMWQPRSTNSLRSGALNIGTSIGVAMGFNVAREFLPGWLHIR